MMVAELISGHEPHDSAVNAKDELYRLFGKGFYTEDKIRKMAASLSDHGICALRAASWSKDVDNDLQLNIPGTPDVEDEIRKYIRLGKKRPGRKIHIV